ncbi:MAG: hypothetical protein C4305_00205 [Thermoleophilia bacterium]
MEALLFVHVLVAMTLLGAAIAACAAGLATSRSAAGSRALQGACFWSAIITAASALVTIVLGEALAAGEDVTGSWLDASRAIAIVGLLGGGLAASLLARLAGNRPRLALASGLVSLLVAVLALAVTFLMAAKPT